MNIYLNRRSNVALYDIHEEYIDVMFYGTNKVYRYSNKVTGKEIVDQLKKLAKNGEGLNSYINRYARKKYECIIER